MSSQFQRLMAGLVATLGLSAALAQPAMAARVAQPPPAPTAPTKPQTPGQIYNGILRFYYPDIGGDGENINVHHLVLTAHSLLRTGLCPARNPIPYTTAQVIRFDSRGWYEKSCTRDPNGKFDVARMIRRGATNPYAAHDDLRPALYSQGDRAAQSVGIASPSHGKASKIVINFVPKTKRSEVDIDYRRSKSTTASGRQLKELVLRTHGKQLTERMHWYR